MTRAHWLAVSIAGLACTWTASTHAAGEGASLETCLAEAVDYSAVYPTKVFPAGTTKEIAAVLRLGKGESYPTMTATWIAVSVPGNQANFAINKVDMDLRGKDRAVVRFKHPVGLPPGSYRLDVAVAGKPWKSASFAVSPIAAAAVKQPGDLLPLRPQTVWRYALTQEFGPGIRPEMPPGTKLDSDGKFRASTAVAVVAVHPEGAHVETRQNGALVNEEWLRVGDTGLVITKIRSGADEEKFNPPHSLWPWPLATPKEWFYEPADKSYRQRFRMWGPMPIKGPAGEAPGYVVLMDQPSPDVSISVERQYLPGVGLVREAITQGRNGKLLTRTSTELTAAPAGAAR